MQSVSSESTETAYNYCLNRAAPDGSNLYYATVFDKTKIKTTIITLHAFLYELSNIIYECSDPGVARIKLKWWQEEIERLFNKQARHPVTKQMQECIRFNPELNSTFDSVIDFFSHFIFIEQPNSLETILSLYKSTSGEVWYQSGKQLNIVETETLKALQEMGAVIHFINCLQQPNTYISESRCIIPLQYLDQSQLLNLRINTDNRNKTQMELFSPLLIELKTKLDHTYKILSKENNVSLRHALILNRLIYKTCDEILRDGCQLLDRNISLTPLRKLWLAWRTRYFH